MSRSSLIKTQCCLSSLAATQPGKVEHGPTQSDFAARGSKMVGHQLLRILVMASLAATMFSTSARAAICEGPVAAVAVAADGRLWVRQGAGANSAPIWVICNIHNSSGYEANVTACKSWQAILMSAHKTGSTVQIYTRSSACNLPDWGTADVYHLEDRG